LFVAAWLAVLGANPSRAQQLLENYQAFLSERDHFNSRGQRLMTAAAIIRQDRANYHRFGLKDQDDESDEFFATIGNRSALERLLEYGRAEPGVISSIVNETPLVRVEVWRGNAGPFVVVTLITPRSTSNVSPKEENASPPPESFREQPSNSSDEFFAMIGNRSALE
jgi:hypothetical protein